MTPEECVDHFIAVGIVPLRNDHARQVVLDTVKMVKADETRRCVARVKIWSARQAWAERRARSVNRELGNEILITGGLEPEE